MQFELDCTPLLVALSEERHGWVMRFSLPELRSPFG